MHCHFLRRLILSELSARICFDKFDNEENPFRFKHHYIFNALESEVLYDLLDIMNGNCNAEIKLFSNNMQKIKNI